ncbi:tRNA 5-methoxyuridine(34)/uridine 5-oxyacetic acid(34) synthase CmoB [Pseudohaliea rubra]|uniref:tRNA U34 carboxymethyltransferase n=1 Tax=Pseudohaliea rubra DSM 19751 TaxID=1265313 RepID=A0A095VS62_9GAMM|nr:tRNA 5-methoxyuridine(34)/uridine 5-oxyacetic acid(34) synthase CmoB [Pseudohaliea rubra]KGE03933.1 tRNA (5-methoxyuridine) 34 synthase [Pseudohaliea rubra DSM 19751]
MNVAALAERWAGGPLAPWASLLREQVAEGLSPARHGDLPRWQAALDALPDIATATVHLDRSRVGADPVAPLAPATAEQLREALQGLHPWRKGPYELFGVHVDTEWRSDWKWDRLAGGLTSLAGRRVLDVGCGNGYHCWRMRGAGAMEVVGIDPSPLFVLQFQALQRYLRDEAVSVLPLPLEALPRPLPAFDTVFSMGVLYHRRSPLDHLLALRDCLRPGGELVLETLIIDGGAGMTLVPQGRYARMGNVWFLPTCATLLDWLAKVKFRDARVVDVSTTSTKEQRRTAWMRSQSLADFLDPKDPGLTIEGYPAPRRAVVVASAP